MKTQMLPENQVLTVRGFMSEAIDIGSIPGDGAQPRHERADAAANRQLILKTAESLFTEFGVEAVTMADIAQAAGVGKGTLYRRYSNKPELCLGLMDEQMLTFQNETLQGMRVLATGDAPALDQLNYFLDSLVHFTDQHLPLLCEVERAGLLPTGHHHENPHIWKHMTIKGLLLTAVREGEAAEDVDVDYMADALLAPLQATIFRYQREARGYSLERISAGLTAMASGMFR